MTSEVKQMLKEVFLAMGLILAVIVLVVLCTYGGPAKWPRAKIEVLLGFAISGLGCAFFMVHMALTYSSAVELIDPTAAQKTMARSTILRYAVLLLLAFLCSLTGWVNMIAFAFGILIIKPALYLQTIVHRALYGPEPEPLMPPEGAFEDEDEDRLPGESHHLGPQMTETILKIDRVGRDPDRKETDKTKETTPVESDDKEQ